MIDAIAAGTTLGAYRVDDLIGRGGMGHVYRALDTRLGRPVALKVLAGELAEDERFRDRLLRESRLAASLDHPNVVPIYEAGESDGRLFIAMRYVHGEDLKDLLRREGALDPARVIAIAAQVADALDAAHRRGLVHRDVKPSNVLLDHADGREHAYLADFGLTQSASDHGPTDGQFMGTVDYVAPEQIRGEDVDGRADQYALGCLLFECLTGTLPFRHRSETGVIFAHLEEPAPRASERRDGLPAALDPVLARGLSKEPGDRFATCTELVTSAADALGVAAPAGRRRGALILAGAAALAAVAAVALAIALSGNEAAATGPAGTLVRIAPDGQTVESRTRIPGYPGAVDVSPGGIWVADFRTGVLWRYGRHGGLSRVTSDGEPRDLAVVGNTVYVAADGDLLSGNVSRYDASTGVRGDRIDLLACAIGSGDGVVWAAGCPAVQRLTTTGPLKIMRQQYLSFPEPDTSERTRVQFRELAVGGGSLWVLGDALDRTLWRLDERSGRVQATIPLRFTPRSVAYANGLVWITDPIGDAVVPIDPVAKRALAPVHVGRGASGVAAGYDSVWVANTVDGTVSRVDPAARRVRATIDVGGLPRELAAGAGGVWVTAYGR